MRTACQFVPRCGHALLCSDLGRRIMCPKLPPRAPYSPSTSPALPLNPTQSSWTRTVQSSAAALLQQMSVCPSVCLPVSRPLWLFSGLPFVVVFLFCATAAHRIHIVLSSLVPVIGLSLRHNSGFLLCSAVSGRHVISPSTPVLTQHTRHSPDPSAHVTGSLLSSADRCLRRRTHPRAPLLTALPASTSVTCQS